MTSIRHPSSALRAALIALGIAMLLLTGTLPGWAHGYLYDTSLAVSGTGGSSSPFAPGDKVEVDFDVTTDDSNHTWDPDNEQWEANKKFRVSLALPSTSQAFGAFDAFDCYSNSVARRSPLVRSDDEAKEGNPIDGVGSGAESATHAGEPVIGGHVLELSNAQVGTVKTTRHDDDSVEANSSGQFVVDAALPDFDEFPTGYEVEEVLLCVESVHLYGDDGNVGVEANGDRHNTGVGLHCGDDLITNDPDAFCFDEEPVSGVSVYSEDGVCFSFCETHNSTPRIQAATRIQLEPQVPGLLPNRGTEPPDTTQ